MLEAVINSNELEGRYISVQFEDKAELTSHLHRVNVADSWHGAAVYEYSKARRGFL